MGKKKHLLDTCSKMRRFQYNLAETSKGKYQEINID